MELAAPSRLELQSRKESFAKWRPQRLLHLERAVRELANAKDNERNEADNMLASSSCINPQKLQDCLASIQQQLRLLPLLLLPLPILLLRGRQCPLT